MKGRGGLLGTGQPTLMGLVLGPQPRLLADFVGSYPVERAVSLHRYRSFLYGENKLLGILIVTSCFITFSLLVEQVGLSFFQF